MLVDEAVVRFYHSLCCSLRSICTIRNGSVPYGNAFDKSRTRMSGHARVCRNRKRPRDRYRVAFVVWSFERKEWRQEREEEKRKFFWNRKRARHSIEFKRPVSPGRAEFSRGFGSRSGTFPPRINPIPSSTLDAGECARPSRHL